MNEKRRVFISHSHKDEVLAHAVRQGLEERGFEVTTPFPEDPGSNLQSHLATAMEDSDAFAFLLTPSSVGSPSIAFELGVAEASGRAIVPVFASAEAQRLAPKVFESRAGLMAEGLSPDEIASHVADVLGGPSPTISASASLIHEIERLALEVGSWFELGQRLQELDAPEDAKRPFVSAFQYDFVEPSEEARRNRWGAFAPMLELASGEVYPIPLSSAPNEWLEAWKSLALSTQLPILNSRISDLLWERKPDERPDRWAREAIDAYLAQSQGGWSSLLRAECLVRARELAARIADNERLEKVATATVLAAAASIDSDLNEPGVALRLIESLLALPRPNKSVEIDRLLTSATNRFANDPWIRQHILELQMAQTSDESSRQELQRTAVELWVDQANQSEGLLRLTHLQRALEMSRNYGVTDLTNELRLALQQIDMDALGLETVSAKATIPKEQSEAIFDLFTSAEGWADALSRFGAYGPPIGSYEDNVDVVSQLMADHPLQFLFPKVILDPEGRPIRNIASPDEQQEAALIEHEVQALSVWGIFSSEILQRVRSAYDLPPEDELAQFFQNDLIPGDLANNLAAAWRLHWAEDYLASAHVSATSCEAVLRELAVKGGFSVYREPQQGRAGSLMTLGELLHTLRPQFDQSWWRYLWTVLAEPLGLNLRNRIAHGLITEVAPQESAILLHVTAFLRLIRINP